jgi:hypothetical protein
VKPILEPLDSIIEWNMGDTYPNIDSYVWLPLGINMAVQAYKMLENLLEQ